MVHIIKAHKIKKEYLGIRGMSTISLKFFMRETGDKKHLKSKLSSEEIGVKNSIKTTKNWQNNFFFKYLKHANKMPNLI